MARRGNNINGWVAVLGGLLVLGVALLVIKWLLITVAILAVPFAAWWLYDRRRHQPLSRLPGMPHSAPHAPGPTVRGPSPTPTGLPARVPTAAGPPVADARHFSAPVQDLWRPSRPPTSVEAVPVRPGLQLSRRRLSAEGRLALVGESAYQQNISRAARGATIGAGFADHLPVVALLVPEPENRHDRCAVRVDLAVGHALETVGYLSRADARSYQPELLRLREAGVVGSCPGRVTGGGPHRSYGVYLHVARPGALLLRNLVGDAEVVEPERPVTVTREEDHQEVLARHHARGEVGPTRVAVALHSATVSRGKHRGSYAVEVRLDGDRVGELTAAMSSRYRLMVVGAEGQGRRTLCEAAVSHGDRGFQIDLRLPAVT